MDSTATTLQSDSDAFVFKDVELTVFMISMLAAVFCLAKTYIWATQNVSPNLSQPANQLAIWLIVAFSICMSGIAWICSYYFIKIVAIGVNALSVVIQHSSSYR